jgi:hypothetical protein
MMMEGSGRSCQRGPGTAGNRPGERKRQGRGVEEARSGCVRVTGGAHWTTFQWSAVRALNRQPWSRTGPQLPHAGRVPRPGRARQRLQHQAPRPHGGQRTYSGPDRRARGVNMLAPGPSSMVIEWSGKRSAPPTCARSLLGLQGADGNLAAPLPPGTGK